MYRSTLILIIFFHLFFSKESTAQVAGSDSISYQSGIKNAIALYHKSTGEQSALYNGARHEGYRLNIKGHAYFDTKEWMDGSICYEDILYQNIPMLYDEVKDELVIQHFNKEAAISLISERISQFSLSGHTFIYARSDNGLTEPGFYDLLYNGNTSLLIKRKKYIQENIAQQEIERKFLTQDQYYLGKGTRYYPIRSSKNIFSVLEDKNKDIRLFLKKNNLNFKTDPELTLLRIAEYYDQLTDPL